MINTSHFRQLKDPANEERIRNLDSLFVYIIAMTYSVLLEEI